MIGLKGKNAAPERKERKVIIRITLLANPV